MKCSYKELFDLVVGIICSYGCKKDQSEAIAQSLLYSECAGDSYHGLRVLKQHVEKLKRQCYNIESDIIVERESDSYSIINCNNTIGLYSAYRCMDYAVEKVKEKGLFAVLANKCNTCSAAFVYTLRAAEKGYIGILMSNTPPTMAPFGGITKLIGTNPFSYAIPTRNETPIVFDMATSVVAKSTIVGYRDNNKPIPDNWAFDKNGLPTTDPQTALEGLMAPLGGAKGYGLSIFIDILSGLLSGANYLDRVNNFFNRDNECMNVGQLFVVIDPKVIYGDQFYSRMDEYIKRIKESEYLSSPVRLPGEKKIMSIRNCQKEGINLEDKIYTELINLINPVSITK